MKKTKKTVKKKAAPVKKTVKSAPKKLPTVVAKAQPKNNTGVTPLGDRVLVKPLLLEEHTTTSFGIIIPDTATKEKPEQGTVVAVGPGRRTDAGAIIPVAIEVGDKVMFTKYGFDEVKVDGVEYYLISEQNILGILS